VENVSPEKDKKGAQKKGAPVSNVQFLECTNSKYVKPKRVQFTLTTSKGEARTKTWDLVDSMDAVALVIYHEEKKSLLFVKQFRVPVWLRCTDEEKKRDDCGFTYEFCAGLVDKKKSLVEIAQEELVEECGYKVDPSRIKQIATCRGNVGITGNRITLFYVSISEKDRTSDGGGNVEEGENIELVFLPLDKSRTIAFDSSIDTPESLGVGLFWFYENIFPQLPSANNKQSLL